MPPAKPHIMQVATMALTSNSTDARKARTQARNAELRAYINQLYHGKPRRRIDDCIALAAAKYHLAVATVERIYAGY